jgi:hypothetical protein
MSGLVSVVFVYKYSLKVAAQSTICVEKGGDYVEKRYTCICHIIVRKVSNKFTLLFVFDVYEYKNCR